MKKIFTIAVFLAALAAFGTQANATIVSTGTTTTLGVVVISTPTSPAYTVVKGCNFCNDTAAPICVQLADNATVKFAICASSYSCSNTPMMANPQFFPVNGLGGFFGEQMNIVGAFRAITPAIENFGAGGVTLTCSYVTAVY